MPYHLQSIANPTGRETPYKLYYFTTPVGGRKVIPSPSDSPANERLSQPSQWEATILQIPRFLCGLFVYSSSPSTPTPDPIKEISSPLFWVFAYGFAVACFSLIAIILLVLNKPIFAGKLRVLFLSLTTLKTKQAFPVTPDGYLIRIHKECASWSVLLNRVN